MSERDFFLIKVLPRALVLEGRKERGRRNRSGESNDGVGGAEGKREGPRGKPEMT